MNEIIFTGPFSKSSSSHQTSSRFFRPALQPDARQEIEDLGNIEGEKDVDNEAQYLPQRNIKPPCKPPGSESGQAEVSSALYTRT